ncbi:MAG: hypothetical protein R3F37_14785 [Candidatus Competibacteraceae bacterium]
MAIYQVPVRAPPPLLIQNSGYEKHGSCALLAAIDPLGVERLGIATPEPAVEQLAAYLQLLERWNRTYNLTAVRHCANMAQPARSR